jgi:replication factor C small subunit
MFNNLLIERYRPKKLDDCVLSSELRAVFESYRAKQEIPNLLFAGTPGVGKTTVAKILVNEVLDCQYLYINASDENGIDVVRTKIANFSQTKSIDGKLKVTILDECLDENTLIWILRAGKIQQIPIKYVDSDTDLVKSYNFDHKKYIWAPFSKIDQGIQDVYEIEFESGESVVCTASHKWFVEIGGNIVRKTLQEIMELNITEIISPEIDGFTAEST